MAVLRCKRSNTPQREGESLSREAGGTEAMEATEAATTDAATTDAAPADRDGNNSDLAELLRTVPLFSRLQEDRLDKLANLLSSSRFAAGDMVIRKGEDSTFMLILISGRVEVYDELNGRAVGS